MQLGDLKAGDWFFRKMHSIHWLVTDADDDKTEGFTLCVQAITGHVELMGNSQQVERVSRPLLKENFVDKFDNEPYLSKREYLASLAMNGILVTYGDNQVYDVNERYQEIAKTSVAIADALLKEIENA